MSNDDGKVWASVRESHKEPLVLFEDCAYIVQITLVFLCPQLINLIGDGGPLFIYALQSGVLCGMRFWSDCT